MTNVGYFRNQRQTYVRKRKGREGKGMETRVSDSPRRKRRDTLVSRLPLEALAQNIQATHQPQGRDRRVEIHPGQGPANP
jgi:hypothetical protein